jgi:RNA polymerase sigma-70 factor (ECF subfamily)
VSALVARIVQSADDADDVVEETFWQAWRQAARFAADRGSVATWLLTIARSRALDRLRATRRQREEAIDDRAVERSAAADGDAFIAPASDPSRDAEAGERGVLVRRALGELPREQREALELGYFGGLSQSEIAERTGQPLGTVKTRMRLGLMKLRELLSVLREDAR